MSISELLRIIGRNVKPAAAGSRADGGVHHGWRAALLLAILGGFMTVSLAAQARNPAFAAILSGGCAVGGGLLGFLFGIPRALRTRDVPAPKQTQPSEAHADDGDWTSDYRGNTNLEEVSDWLTKILVGVGLTQLRDAPNEISRFGAYFGPSLTGNAAGETLAVAILLYFSVTGFLFGFLWSRLFLGRAFTAADAVARVERRLDAQELQARNDVAALSLLARQLRPEDDNASVDAGELKTRLRNSSVSVKIQAFGQAELMRRNNWRDPSTKPLMERTIPIFQALAEADEEERFHANWGQLGFAFKDQRVPDWSGAEAALSRAIRIRGRAGRNSSVYYEFNRAICRIHLDAAFQQGQPSSADVQKAIRADLSLVDAWNAELTAQDTAIQRWRQLNP